MAKPSLYQRASIALSVFRRGFPGNSKKAPFMWPSYIDGKPQWQMYEFQDYAEDGFSRNAIIYEAIMFKCRQVASAPLRAYQGDPTKPTLAPLTHPLQILCMRPNIHQSMMEFQQQNTVYLNLAGNVYILLDRGEDRDNAIPAAMYSLRPDRVKIVPAKGGIKGYRYTPEWLPEGEGIPILPQDMMHIKLPNPMDGLEGMGQGLSPISPMARSGDVDNELTDWLKMFVQKGTQGFGFIEVDASLDADTIARLRDTWDENYGGSENWGRPIVLDKGAKWNKGTGSMKEIGEGLNAIDMRNESRILGPFGVPPQLVGARVGLEHSTYSNYEEARKSFWEDTFTPELGLYEVDFQYYLRDGETFVKHDLSGVPALRKDMKLLAESAEILIRNGVPPNVAFHTVGLDIPPIEGGDVSYFPTTLVPIGMAGTQLLPPTTDSGQEGEGESVLEDGRQQEAAGLRLLDEVKKNLRLMS